MGFTGGVLGSALGKRRRKSGEIQDEAMDGKPSWLKPAARRSAAWAHEGQARRQVGEIAKGELRLGDGDELPPKRSGKPAPAGRQADGAQ
ncbi:hypothetical protein An11g07430 [Aspergillus niger]|uniref:Uncharacterized protein n=2 Tax=Aspergillus niger TaxID=5061 RepID=A2QX31_ASPNC|nr:hypothetical protein An11g07430 [Aspergillus niger]CAK40787.1 hypothetical protein An11g07430 [Aspergillus niger]